MKRTLFFIAFIFSLIQLNAQTLVEKKESYTEKTIFFAGLKTFNPSFSVEYSLSSKFALEAGVAGNWGLYSDFWSRRTNFIMIPSLYLNYRFFYNKSKRWEKGKNIGLNSANYITVGAENFFPMGFSNNSGESLNTVNAVHLSIYWGLRRTVFNKMRFAFEVGPGMEFLTNITAEPQPFIGLNLNFGWHWQKK